MTKEFRLEDPGEGIHEAEIKEVHVSEGDEVADGDIILTVETDKAAVDVPAPFDGVIEEIRVAVGDIAEVGEVLMTYRELGESDEDKDRGAASQVAEEPEKKREETGEAEEAEKEETEALEEPRSTARSERGPVPASPATRRLARELKVDLASVEPSEPEGRVTAEDVRAAAEAAGTTPAGKKGEEKRKTEKVERQPRPLPDFARWGDIERIPLRSIRRATAKHMARSWAEIPHVMHQDEVDITKLEQWRHEHREAAREHGGKLTLTILVMKAVVAALKEFPHFNASIDMENEEIILKQYHHIGVAVDTERGLVVPVVRDVDRKSIVELAAELTELAERARRDELKREDMQGGTFTITNPGPIGGRSMTPIINHPQVAILGLGRASLEPKIIGDLNDYEVAARLILPMCLGFDHRINDGADAARFVSQLAATLSDAETIFLTT